MIQTPSDFDNETMLLLDISVEFLVRFLGYERAAAEEMTSRFLASDPGRFNEDFIHHEMPWGVAACIHYLEGLRAPRQDLGRWLVETGRKLKPPEANDYMNRRLRGDPFLYYPFTSEKPK